jgi:hypothetical protein
MCSIGTATTENEIVFHECAQFSLAQAVNGMWKLCKAGKKSGARPSSTTVSEKFGTDF